jgi:hypothetical protein
MRRSATRHSDESLLFTHTGVTWCAFKTVVSQAFLMLLIRGVRDRRPYDMALSRGRHGLGRGFFMHSRQFRRVPIVTDVPSSR